jgi:hypothetical protein
MIVTPKIILMAEALITPSLQIVNPAMFRLKVNLGRLNVIFLSLGGVHYRTGTQLQKLAGNLFHLRKLHNYVIGH